MMPQFKTIMSLSRNITFVILVGLFQSTLASATETGMNDFEWQSIYWEPYIELDSFSYAQATEINSLMNKFSGSLGSGDIIFTHNQVEIGFGLQYKSHEVGIGYIARYDYLVRHSDGAVELLYNKGNDLPTDETRDYELYMKVNRIRANGLALSYGYTFQNQLKVKITGYDLETSKIMDGFVDGRLVSIDNDLTYKDVDLNYAYSEDIVLKRDVVAPEGEGVALDIDIQWLLRPSIRADLSIYDAYTNFEWDAAPNTVAHQNSEPVTFDENGIITVLPTLQGDNTPRSYSQRLPRRTYGALSYIKDNIRYSISDYHIPSTHFTEVSMEYSSRYGRFVAGYYIEQKAFEIGYQSSYFTFNLKADDIKLKKSKMIGLTIGLNSRF